MVKTRTPTPRKLTILDACSYPTKTVDPVCSTYPSLPDGGGAQTGVAMPELMINGGGGGGRGGGGGTESCGGGGLTFDAIAGREEEAVVVDYILNKSALLSPLDRTINDQLLLDAVLNGAVAQRKHGREFGSTQMSRLSSSK
ncbi:hypothetical protein RRG08_006965 [Elysia crispata]|uniref:Uncharacterized protein n=1 Tax=Elysia crispata TaxID=231223 RepID=A0AAE1D9Q9_9GAST|nr:hypothetical protein RRG08_006965 [Elysia crispata]